MKNFNKKQKIIAIILLIIICTIFYFYNKNTQNNIAEIADLNLNTNTNENKSEIKEETEEKSKEKVIVHITGAVKNNGVYELEPESRIIDVINKAGGLAEDADVTTINLAYKIEDGMKIHIPKKGENLENNTIQNSNNITTESGLPKTNTEGKTSQSNNQTKKVNINTATKEELDTLPGIGESTAQKIIDYRNKNGKFTSIEEIKEVSGIGESKYEKIKDMIIL